MHTVTYNLSPLRNLCPIPSNRSELISLCLKAGALRSTVMFHISLRNIGVDSEEADVSMSSVVRNASYSIFLLLGYSGRLRQTTIAVSRCGVNTVSQNFHQRLIISLSAPENIHNLKMLIAKYILTVSTRTCRFNWAIPSGRNLSPLSSRGLQLSYVAIITGVVTNGIFERENPLVDVIVQLSWQLKKSAARYIRTLRDVFTMIKFLDSIFDAAVEREEAKDLIEIGLQCSRLRSGHKTCESIQHLVYRFYSMFVQ